MRVLLIAFILYSQSFMVNGSFLDYMSVKFNEWTGFVYKAFNSFSRKIKQFLTPPARVEEKRDKKGPLFVDRPVTHNMRTAFSDFTEFQVPYGQEHLVGFNENVNPTLLQTTPQLAHWHGRVMESHVVQTKDDYFLTVHRIATNLNLQANRTVLLHHGLFGSSTDWILLGPTKSLPYILADAGFDVWITNARGNYYSRGHSSRHVECADYWNFSWQEMGELDLPAVIDHIRQTKNMSESINFIGHSMGATALIVLLSSMPKYNEYLRMGILLAPLVYMNNVKGPLKIMTGMSEEVIKQMGNGEFLPNRKVPSWLATKYCKGPKIFCSNPLLFLSGVRKDQKRSASFVARLLHHVPAGCSTNTLLHYMQVAHSGKFHRFNQPDATFSLNSVTLPIALISASNDWLASIPDVLKLYLNLLNPIDHYIIRNKNITHTDLVWGVNANILVFRKIIEYLEKGLVWNMEQQNEVI